MGYMCRKCLKEIKENEIIHKSRLCDSCYRDKIADIIGVSFLGLLIFLIGIYLAVGN